MLRKMLSLGALVVVALAFGVGNAAAKNDRPPKAGHSFFSEGFSDGRFMNGNMNGDGFSDGRD